MPPLDGKDDWITAPAAEKDDWITAPSTNAEGTPVNTPAWGTDWLPSRESLGFGAKGAPAPDLSAPSPGAEDPMTTTTNIGPTLGKIAGAAGDIAKAGAKGAAEGFGTEPLGLSPQSEDGLVKAGIYNAPDENNPLKGLNKAVIGGVSSAADLALRAGNALFRGGQAAVAQTGEELGAPQLGRDIAAFPEAFMGSPHGLGTPKLISTPGEIARDVVAAPTIEAAIDAATRAASGATAESPQFRLLRQTEGAILRRVDGDESRLTPAESARVANLRTKMSETRGAEDVSPNLAGDVISQQDAPRSGDLSSTPADSGIEDTGSAVVASEPQPPAPRSAATSAQIPQTSAEAKAVASAYYNKADQIGGTLLPDFTNKFISEAESIAPQTPEGRAIAGDTPITGLIDRLQSLRDEPISLQGAQEIDERLGDLIDKEYGLKGLSKEGHNLLDLQTTFRNMIMDAGPADATNGVEGFEAIKQGRAAWAQAMKMMDFERILNRADQTDNPVTSIRAGIRALTSNPARIRGYSPEEIAALKDAANRGVLGSVLHVFGSRLTPLAVGAAGLSTGIVPGLVGAGLSHGGASLLRSGATALQTRRVNNAMSVLGAGVPQMPQ